MIAILGAGAWGSALAINLCARHPVNLWVRSAEQAQAIAETRQNQRYLPGYVLPANINIQVDLQTCLAGCSLVLIAVPTHGFRATLKALSQASLSAPVVWACKGFEQDSAKLPHQIVREELPPHHSCGVLSGPSFAQEVAQGLPTALTLASKHEDCIQETIAKLHNNRLRVYRSDDVIGVELGGAVKNVLAIAAGISDGMHFGHNARSALITRGLAELIRLGEALGGKRDTFMGLAGAGDLILTATGDLSRNRQVGLQLAQGKKLSQIVAELGHIAEGVHSARAVVRLAQENQIEMPITEAVNRVLLGELTPKSAVEGLLNRVAKAEI